MGKQKKPEKKEEKKDDGMNNMDDLPNGRNRTVYRTTVEESYRDHKGRRKTRNVDKVFFGEEALEMKQKEHGIFSSSDKVAGYSLIALLMFLVAFMLGFI